MTTEVDWRRWSGAQLAAFRDRLAQHVYDLNRDLWHPYPWQGPHAHPPGHAGPCTAACLDLPPAEVPTHGVWMMLGGRGTGKTDGCARYVDEHVNGPPCDRRIAGGHRVAIVAPTAGDAAESCVTGPSGLRAHNPGIRLKHGQGGSKAVWANGAEARLFGAYTPEDVERLRAGGNRCLIWLEEVAAMRYLDQALEHTAYGLRIGPRPHYVASTTPKPRPALRTLISEPGTILTRGRTQDATHLETAVRDRLYRKYLGTRQGRQELEGTLLEDIEGALWSWAGLDADRVLTYPAGLHVVVAVDPAASNTEDSDETGIVVVGVSPDRTTGYVLDDLSGRYDPEEWARLALDAVERWGASHVVAEKNNGGDMVAATLRAQDRTARYRLVTASRGKRVRAEPVSVLYAQRRIHHVGSFPDLEEQMTSWTPEDSTSPDRLDALVWGFTEAMLGRRGGSVSAA